MLIICRFASAQNSYLKVSAKNPFEKTIIDSVGYKGIHKDLESLFDETKNLSSKLALLGYIENEITKAQKSNDSTFNFSCALG